MTKGLDQLVEDSTENLEDLGEALTEADNVARVSSYTLEVDTPEGKAGRNPSAAANEVMQNAEVVGTVSIGMAAEPGSIDGREYDPDLEGEVEVRYSSDDEIVSVQVNSGGEFAYEVLGFDRRDLDDEERDNYQDQATTYLESQGETLARAIEDNTDLLVNEIYRRI